MKHQLKNKNRGFTIVELVVVIAIIAVLAAIAIPVFSSVIKNSKETAASKTGDNIYINILAYGGESAFEKGLEKIVNEMKASNEGFVADENGSYTVSRAQILEITSNDTLGLPENVAEISISADYKTMHFEYNGFRVTVRNNEQGERNITTAEID